MHEELHHSTRNSLKAYTHESRLKFTYQPVKTSYASKDNKRHAEPRIAFLVMHVGC